MKKLILIALLATAACFPAALHAQAVVRADTTSQAQDRRHHFSHLKFMGNPISGTPRDFYDTMKGKGFKPVDGNPRSLVGRFAGEEDCTLTIFSKEDFVWKVAVAFPAQQSWPMVKSRYDRFKIFYTDKYGKPDCTESLSRRFPAGTGKELWGFEDESSIWQSVYHTADGTIILSIRYNTKKTSLYLEVDYIDEMNRFLKEQIELEDI